MRITWEQTGDEFPRRWNSNCVTRAGKSISWFGRITALGHLRKYLLSIYDESGGCVTWEHCNTLTEAKARGAEVLRALCGGPARKSATVWCGVDTQGRVMPLAIGTTRVAAWWALVCCLGATCKNPKQAKAAGFTVRRFRLEEVR